MAVAFQFFLEGAQESPINTTPLGRGTGYALFDPVSGNLSYFFAVSGLDMGPLFALPAQSAATPDNVTLMHFHNGAVGVNGGVVFDIKTGTTGDDDLIRLNTTPLQGFPFSAPANTISGIWENGESGNSIAPFVAALTAATPFQDMPLYINIHTVQKPGGELRGQLFGMSTENADIVFGSQFEDFLLGLGGADTLVGGEGDDHLDGGAGADTIEGGDGSDTLFFAFGGPLTDIIVDFGESGTGYAAKDGEFDALNSIENADGGAGNDFLIGGNSGNNLFRGFGGTDAILGGSGDDMIFGGDGDRDYLMGGKTYDPAEVGTGADTINGEGGTDVIHGQDGVDTLNGGDGADFILGGVGGDFIDGGAGDDFLFAGSSYAFNVTESGGGIINGGAGVDLIVGVSGIDELNGGPGDDIIYGGDGADRINTPTSMHDLDAGDGNDSLFGDAGDDIISAGGGFDYIRGGAGADIIRFRVGDSFDTMFDWSIAEGDHLRLDPAFGVLGFGQFQSMLTGFTHEGIDYTVLPLGADQLTIANIRPNQWTATMVDFSN